MKVLITALTMIITSSAVASPSEVGSIQSQERLLTRASEILTCYRADKDKNDVIETSVVTLETNGSVGFLGPRFIRQDFEDETGEICARIARMVKESVNNFTAISVTVDSTLLMDRASIVEELQLAIQNVSPTVGEDGAPLRVKLSATVAKALQMTGNQK